MPWTRPLAVPSVWILIMLLGQEKSESVNHQTGKSEITQTILPDCRVDGISYKWVQQHQKKWVEEKQGSLV